MVTTARRSDTRERILDAALELFAEEGFLGTTISAVERKVGLAAGTGSLYRHFASKEELLQAAVEREVARVVAEIEADRAALAADVEGEERLAQDYTQCLRDLRRFDRLVRLALSEGERVPEVRDAISRALAVARKGSTWDRDPGLVVAIAALAGYHLLSAVEGRPFRDMSERRFVETLVGLTC